MQITCCIFSYDCVMKMKKLIAITLCGVLLFAMFGCSKTTTSNNSEGDQTQSADVKTGTESKTNTQSDSQSEKDRELAAAEAAYEQLVLAETACCEVMDSIYAAWHFAVYENGNFTNATDCYKAYIEATKLDYDSTLDILNEDLADLDREINGQTQMAYLCDIGTAVDLVLFAYSDNGILAGVAAEMEKAKEALKSLTDRYAADTGYGELKKYYVEIESYFEYIKNPTGSFDDLGALVNTYETNMRNYRKSLELTFE